MIDPLTHGIADAMLAVDKERNHYNIGYVNYQVYAHAAMEYLRAHGYKEMF